MPKISWDPSLNVNVKELDLQHQHLVDFMNEIYDKLDQKSLTSQELQDFFQRIQDHAREHFATEEKDFELCAYPGATAHIAEHRRIERRISDLKQAYEKAPSEKLIFDTLEIMGNWLFVHIREYDQKYTRYLNEHGLF